MDIIKYPLCRRADVNAPGGKSGTSLQTALEAATEQKSKEDYENIVNSL